MEPNPLGVPEIEYAAKREALMRKMDPQETAIFLLLENMYNLEQAHNARSHELTWNRGESTQDQIDRPLLGIPNPSLLPMPHRGDEFHHYTPFQWRISDSKSGELIASLDMRIMLDDDGLTIRANLGELIVAETEVIGLIGQIPYPASAWDDWGFMYENEALRAAEQ